MRWALVAILMMGCTVPTVPVGVPLLAREEPLPQGPTLNEVVIADEGLSSGYQDDWFDTFKRGRGNIVADFDGDGDPDVFSANPGNESFLIVNTTPVGGPLSFSPGQVLSEEEWFYGGVAADFDNDGDPDLPIAAGANDGQEFDRYWRNDRDQGAPSTAPLVDASLEMRLTPVDPVHGVALPNGTMGMRAFDVDNDGRLDLFASNEIRNIDDLIALEPDDVTSLNQLYIQNAQGQLVDGAQRLGIAYQAGSRHASVFDFDRDGDMDIFDNAFTGESVFWSNTLMETGELGFENITASVALDGAELGGPYVMQSMCSIPVDLDNDGWEDLLILHRGVEKPYPSGAVFGHQVLMNQQGAGFVDVAPFTGLNDGWWDHPPAEETGVMGWWGVMGCQVGDVNLDGFPDLFLGNGGGGAGEVNRLFVWSGMATVDVGGLRLRAPIYDDWTTGIDFPPPAPPGETRLYPLRTHGTAFVDFDRDGVDELSVHNGGPAARDMEEPNRLYTFDLPDPRFLRVVTLGDGVSVNRDGIGTRIRVRVERDSDGLVWDVWKTYRSGTGFGAQNGRELVFGLADGDRVLEVEVFWPDGHVDEVEPPDGTQSWLTVER